MSKITLNNVGSLIDATTAAATINANNTTIQAAFDNTLSRDGTSPNVMGTSLDMNSHDIINLLAPTSLSSPLRLQELQDFLSTGGTVSTLPVGGTTGQVLDKISNTNFNVGWTDTLSNKTLVAPALGTPVSGVLTNCTGTALGLTVGLAGNVVTNANLTGAVVSVGNAASLGSFTSANLATALTDETGTGSNVFATSPTLVTPNLGTPSAGVLTNCTGSALSLTVGLAGNVITNANLTGPIVSSGNATSIASQTGTGTKFVMDTSPVLVTPNLGTPSAGVLTSCTGTAAGLTSGNVTTNANLTGAITSVGNASSLGSFTSANLRTALTDETGSGAAVFATSPALVTPTGIVKGDVGLGNVDNTSDATKNSAIATLVNKTLTSCVINSPTGIVKGDVGLGNVDNTSDATKYAATKTLTNTTYDTAGTGNSFSINGVAATANTGTGSVVRATSPTLVTPALGVATATTINGVTLDNTAWTTYTPTVTSQGGTATTTSAAGRYKVIGKTCHVSVQVSITNHGTATGSIFASIPFTSFNGSVAYLGGTFESGATGRGSSCSILPNAAIIGSKQSDATTWWVDGYVINMAATYETA